MILFQALGSQYSYAQAWKHFFTIGASEDIEELKKHLSFRYSGEVEVYHKGRAALSEAIRIATGGEGKVIISGFTCISVPQAVEAAGCEPVYVDITKADLNFDTKALEKTLTKVKGIKAIVVQNTMGMTCDINAIKKIADKHKILIIEDLAHSAGANYNDGSEVGTVGDITMLSFGRDKAIDVASGGALIVRKKSLQSEIISPKNRTKWFDSFRDRLYPIMMWHVRATYRVGFGRVILWFAYKLQLAVKSADGVVDATVKMPKWQIRRVVDEFVRLENRRTVRLSNVMMYANKLPEKLIVPGSLMQGSVPVRFPLLVSNRKELLTRFRSTGLYLDDTWYDAPVGPKRYYGSVNYPEADCPVAVEVASTIVNLPTHEDVQLEHLNKIAELVSKVAK